MPRSLQVAVVVRRAPWILATWTAGGQARRGCQHGAVVSWGAEEAGGSLTIPAAKQEITLAFFSSQFRGHFAAVGQRFGAGE